LLGKKPQIDKVNTIIGAGTQIEGKITTLHSLRIDGTIEGEIRAEGLVIIGKDGIVKGDVYASSLTVEGLVEGNVYVSDSLHLIRNCQLNGDITAESIEIEQGALFNGKSTMKNKNANQKSTQHKEKEKKIQEAAS
jgi:cytoskeletal protein CcmA (bactofilin family)